MTSNKIFMLAGPTASGKTSLSFKLCDQFPFEIISVDSALIYKGMDIGTAKPSDEERSQYFHHLVDILEPWEQYSVASFIKDAQTAIKQIQSKGKIPLLVGGTMLYFKSLIEGINDLPSQDKYLRQQIQVQANQHGWPAIHNQLKKLDPVAAENIDSHDGQRIQRALEVIYSTGELYSQLIEQQTHQMPFDCEFISLVPGDRLKLHKLIEKRFYQMLDAGFLQEVRQLYQDQRLSMHLPSMRCVGYRQAWDYLSGQYDYEQFVQKSIVATRQLAKRQLTWLRNWKSCQNNLFDCFDHHLEHKITQLVMNKL